MAFVEEWSQVSDATLGESDLPAVHSAVSSISDKLSTLATQLGLPPGTVDRVMGNYNVVEAMRQILLEWLRRNYNTEHHGLPSWRMLCSAVASEAGGCNKRLASEIAAQHLCVTEEHSESTGDDHNWPRGCGCGHCTVDSIVEQGCPSPTDSKLPILLLDPEHKLGDEETELVHETKAIVKLFRKCVWKTWEGLLCQKVDIKKVKVNLLSHFGSSLCNSSELESATEHDTILKLLGKFQSWFNFEILQDLANDLLADNEEVCSLWKDYSSKLHEYAIGRKIRDYEGVMFGSSESELHKRVYFKIDCQFDMQVSDLHTLRSSLSDILHCPRRFLYFVTVHCSDTVLEVLIPLPLYEDLFPLSPEQLRELASIGVTDVETDIFKVHVAEGAELETIISQTATTTSEPFKIRPAIRAPPLTVVRAATSDILNIGDISEVLRVVSDVFDWKVLGLFLGLHYSTIMVIETEQHGNIDACTRKMFAAWLQQRDSVPQMGVPSWSVLRAAVEKIGDYYLANRIEMHCKVESKKRRRRRTI